MQSASLHAVAPALLPCAARVVKGLMVVMGCRLVFGVRGRVGVVMCPRTPRLTSVLGTGWLPAGHMM